MRKPYAPRPYQPPAIEHMLDHPRCALWAGMGLGKTLSTLTALDTLQLTEGAPALVLAPKRVAQATWPDEAAKWAHLSGVEVSAVVGTAAERRAALARPASVYATNYDNVPWLIEEYSKRWPFETIVADESTRLKSFRARQGGMRARALAKIAHTKVSRFIELTGTPAPNGLIDLWGQAWFLDGGQRLGRSFEAFKSRWFRSIQVGADRFAVRLEPLPHAHAEITALLSDLCLTIDPRDHFDLREPIVTTIRVDLPTKARRLYDAMEKELFAQLECGTEVEAFSAASRTIKCLQIANGAIYTDDTQTAWSEIHDAKIQALDSVIQEAAGSPILVAYHFKHDAARLQRAIDKCRLLAVGNSTIQEWSAGRVPVLLAHPQSAGHGLNLQDGGHHIVYFGHWWDLEARQQILERIGPVRQKQAGYDRPVYVYNIVAADTIDEDVIARVETKAGVQELLLARMKRQK